MARTLLFLVVITTALSAITWYVFGAGDLIAVSGLLSLAVLGALLIYVSMAMNRTVEQLSKQELGDGLPNYREKTRDQNGNGKYAPDSFGNHVMAISETRVIAREEEILGET